MFTAIFNWKVSVYGESRPRGLEGVGEGRPSTTTLLSDFEKYKILVLPSEIRGTL